MKFFLEIYKITNSQIKGSFLSIINNIKKKVSLYKNKHHFRRFAKLFNI